ncbi:MAG: YafY family transcriptional regulator [Crocinitomicaceae bacterium]|nr:YafY family transcriptional regulator [Crocinitomicaceae bacterium]
MMSNDTKRLSRLTAIMTQLQAKQLVTASELAAKFTVSIRTIYRDIRALEEAGIPVVTEEGKGYTLMEGYRIPPVMFTEQQANALILAQQLVLKSKDASFVNDYSEAIEKIQSVLRNTLKDKTNLLAERTRFDFNTYRERTSNLLSDLQAAITNFYIINMRYIDEAGDLSERLVEPFALLSTQEDNWLLIAWCRLRGAFRYFRVDRIERMSVLSEHFIPHKMTLQEFFDNYY